MQTQSQILGFDTSQYANNYTAGQQPVYTSSVQATVPVSQNQGFWGKASSIATKVADVAVPLANTYLSVNRALHPQTQQVSTVQPTVVYTQDGQPSTANNGTRQAIFGENVFSTISDLFGAKNANAETGGTVIVKDSGFDPQFLFVIVAIVTLLAFVLKQK